MVMHHSFGPVHTESDGRSTWEVRDEMNDFTGQKTFPSAAWSCGHLVKVSRQGRLDRIQRGTAQLIVDHTFVLVQSLNGLLPLMVATLVVHGAAPAEQMSDVRPQEVMRSADRWSEAAGVAPAPLLTTQVDVPFDLLSS